MKGVDVGFVLRPEAPRLRVCGGERGTEVKWEPETKNGADFLRRAEENPRTLMDTLDLI
jgi:hypothetical protein